MGTHLWSLKSNLQNRHKKCSKWEPSKILPRRPNRGCPRHSRRSELATPSLPPPALSPRLSRKSRPSSPDASTSKRPANTLPSTPPRPPLWSPRRRPPRPTVTFTCPMSPSWLWSFVSVVSTRSRQSPKRSSSFCDFDKSATAFCPTQQGQYPDAPHCRPIHRLGLPNPRYHQEVGVQARCCQIYRPANQDLREQRC